MADQLIKNLINHNEFYGNGYYHKQIFKGNVLIWEKNKKKYESTLLFTCSPGTNVINLSQLNDEKILFVLNNINSSVGNYAYNTNTDTLIIDEQPIIPELSEDASFCVFTDDNTVLSYPNMYEDFWSGLKKIGVDSNLNYNFITDVEVASNLEPSSYKNNYMVRNWCTLDNGLLFGGVRELNGIEQSVAYYAFNNNTNTYYIVESKTYDSGMVYVYSNFTTNNEKNRLWGFCQKIIVNEENNAKLDYYSLSIVEFEYPESISTTDNLIVKKVLFETNDYYNFNQQGSGSKFMSSVECNELWCVNNKIFAKLYYMPGAHNVTQPYEKMKFIWIDTETNEVIDNNFIETYPYEDSYNPNSSYGVSDPSISVKGTHYYNGTYYFFSTRYQIHKVVISTSKNLKKWEHCVTDIEYEDSDNGTTTKATNVLFDEGIAYMLVYDRTLPSLEQESIHKIIL